MIKGFASDELEPFRVPPEMCVTEPTAAEHYHDSWERQAVYVMSKRGDLLAHTDVSEGLRRLSWQTWDLRSIFEIEAVSHLQDAETLFVEQLRQSLPASQNCPPRNRNESWRFLPTPPGHRALPFVGCLVSGVSMPMYLSVTSPALMNARTRKPSSFGSKSHSGPENGSSTRRASIGCSVDGNARCSPNCRMRSIMLNCLTSGGAHLSRACQRS